MLFSYHFFFLLSAYRIGDTREFTWIQQANGTVNTFQANYDSVTEVTNAFPYTFTVRKTRLYPITWVNAAALKWELFGCSRYLFNVKMIFFFKYASIWH